MYLSRGLGQITGGYNPCGPGLDFINAKCVQNPHCNVPTSGAFFCPPGFHTVVGGTPDEPISDAQYQALLASMVAEAANYVAPVATPVAAIPAPAPAVPGVVVVAPAAAAGGFPWLLVLAAAGVGLWLYNS
jgi:hypothetical protein